uniref:Splicing factor YJU2 n=1 Tax=Gouania willdenowi TaxID=441366 RepID=A0A8C5HXF6_GOUWI
MLYTDITSSVSLNPGVTPRFKKYYPPDFDPAKIPKLKRSKGRQYVVRLMAPFNMRCKTCGEYIYKGRKFNARKETVPNELCMGLPIFRFYIKCTRCLAEITFKTDPTNTDYAIEHGATRNFQGEVSRIQQERDDEELNDPIKVLENRMKENKREMEVLENLQELKELNQRQAQVDYDGMICREMNGEEPIKMTEGCWLYRYFFYRDVLELQWHKRKRNPDSDDEEESSSSSTQLQKIKHRQTYRHRHPGQPTRGTGMMTLCSSVKQTFYIFNHYTVVPDGICVSIHVYDYKKDINNVIVLLFK